MLPKDRHQLEFTSLEDLIEQDNAVRFVDAFVKKLELDKLSFKINLLLSQPELSEDFVKICNGN